MSLTAPITDDEALLYCPACGYDLRASSVGRCNECGLIIDLATLRVSAFPWAHRREMGRVRAYVKTVWQVLIAARSLDYETAKPQDPRDARSFARVTGVLMALAVLAPLIAAALASDGLSFLAIPPPDTSAPGGPWVKGPALELVIPWAAGITFWPVLLPALVLGCFALPRAARPMFRRTWATSVQNDRAAAIAVYATAPLALLLPSIVFLILIALMEHASQVSMASPTLNVILIFSAGALGLFALLGTLVRTGQWFARVRHAGFATRVAGAAGLVGLWVATLGVYGVLVPWCGGYLWLVLDSLRR